MTYKLRALDLRQLRAALRENVRLVIAVVLLGLLGGALFARAVVPTAYQARASARIVHEPHAIASRALDDEVLGAAQRRAETQESLTSLRERLRLRFDAGDLVTVQLLGNDEAATRRLADALVETYVTLANERRDAMVEAAREKRRGELAAAEAAHARAAGALAEALAREGVPELPRTLADLHRDSAGLETEAREASLAATAAEARVAAMRGLSRQPAVDALERRLIEAQRTLSRLLAQYAAEHPDIAAVRAHLAQLQAQTAELTRLTLTQQLEARAYRARARTLDERLIRARTELARLQVIGARAAPQATAESDARARIEALTAQPPAHEPPRAEAAVRAQITPVESRGARMLVAALVPVLALLFLFGSYAIWVGRGQRVAVASELAQALSAPVLASSSWPRQRDGLDALVEELAESAIEAPGVTLVVPVSERERPLAATLTARLNASVQRHYRSLSGGRIVIAQAFLEELGGVRLKRACALADRVLWVAASGLHRGEEIAECAARSERFEGVAGLLVDGDARPPRSVGSARDFWRARSGEVTGTDDPAALGRVPLH